MENTTLDYIDWFEEKMGRKYPLSVSAFLKAMVSNNSNFTINIDCWAYGELEILDFKQLANVVSDTARLPTEFEKIEHPYYITTSIESYIADNSASDYHLKFANLLPFAFINGGDTPTYFCFLNNHDRPIIFNSDWHNPFRQLHKTIDELFDLNAAIQNIQSGNSSAFTIWSKVTLTDLVAKNKLFFGDYTCADDANAYENIIASLLEITEGMFSLKSFTATETEGIRNIHLLINDLQVHLVLEGNTKWVDAENLVTQLNKALITDTDENSFYYIQLPSWGEYGIVYGTVKDVIIIDLYGYTTHPFVKNALLH